MARVLIVDDEPDILLLLRIALETDGYETALAADGEMALERINKEPFDLMLLDVMMPVMDGWGVLEALPSHPAPPRVVIVSAKADEKDIVRAIELGAAEYLVKPVDIDNLSRVVDSVLRWSDDELGSHRQRRVGR